VKAGPRFSAWAAVPDGVTALMFAAVWWFPFVFGALSVKTAMLTMLVEFFLIHATGFFTAIANQPRSDRRLRIVGVLGLSLFYLLMIGAFAWTFGEWWPLLAFGWLAVGKLFWILRSAPASDDDTMVQMAAWAGSVVAYLFACFVTVILPVPRLGMTAELQPQFGFGEGQGGLWIEQPQTVVAMGVLYFALLCAAKVLAARWSAAKPAA
jgi:ABC-type multidrug transport system fused ATPase/permease subunit